MFCDIMVFNSLKETILKKSNSYNKYKSFYENNQNNLENDNQNEFLNEIKEIQDLSKKNNLYNQEMLYAQRFNDTIRGSNWLIKKNFSLNKSSASYSFLYVLFRVLDEIKPNNILELGLGQSSKITTQYAKFNNSNLKIIESDKDWIDIFSKNLESSENINVLQIDTEELIFNSTTNLKYKDFSKDISNDSFDLIIIDGPYGYDQSYPRSNIWDFLKNISKDFVIIIDDYERIGEQNTVKEFLKILDENNIQYGTVEFEGIKKQLVIFTEKYKFVSWF